MPAASSSLSCKWWIYGLLAVFFLVWRGQPARGELVLAPPSTNRPSANLPPPIIRPVGTNLYALGVVLLDSKAREIRFPGTVNMVEGAVEYLLVSGMGKLHESVLRTEAEPLHIHLAKLFLDPKDSTPGQTNDLWEVWVEWEEKDQVIRRAAGDLVQNSTNQQALATTQWPYQGARLQEGLLTAQRDGSIISVIKDPDALIFSPDKGNLNDEIWQPFKEKLPKAGSAVQIYLKPAPTQKVQTP